MAEIKQTADKAVVGVIVSAVGAGLTAVLGVLSSGNTALIILTGLSAAVTAAGVGLGVYQAVNKPFDPSPDTFEDAEAH